MRIARLLAILVTLVVTSSCSEPPKSVPPPVPRVAQKPAIPTDAVTCREKGGNWSQQGLLGGPLVCDLKTSDAGVACHDSKECEGLCLVPKDSKDDSPASGACSSFVRNYGCFKFAENGVVRGICAD